MAEDLNFSIDNRCCIGLIGPNGAGKSSLFDMLTGIVDADGGQIRFEDRDISRLAPHVRARMGIVRAFQIPRPFTQLSVYENVLTAASYGAGLSGLAAQRKAVEVLAGPACCRWRSWQPATFVCSIASGWNWRKRMASQAKLLSA